MNQPGRNQPHKAGSSSPRKQHIPVARKAGPPPAAQPARKPPVAAPVGVPVGIPVSVSASRKKKVIAKPVARSRPAVSKRPPWLNRALRNAIIVLAALLLIVGSFEFGSRIL